MGDNDVFDSEVPTAPQTTEGVSPEAPPAQEQPRDEGGRFAPKDKGDEGVSVEPTPSGEPPAPVDREAAREAAGRLTALMDERDKRRALEARLAEYERQQQSEPQELPDPVEDPQNFAQSLQITLRQQLDTQEAHLSEFFARKEFGDEAVNAALQAAQASGAVQYFTRGVDRWHRLVQWHQQQTQYAERSSPEYEANLRAKIEAEVRAKYEQPSPSPARIPRSLASAPASGGSPPPGTGDPLFD